MRGQGNLSIVYYFPLYLTISRNCRNNLTNVGMHLSFVLFSNSIRYVWRLSLNTTGMFMYGPAEEICLSAQEVLSSAKKAERQ